MILSVRAYTHKVFSNFKSLQQAQVFFTDGWVQDLEMVKVGQKTVVRSKVNHSMRLSQKPLQPWVILTACGEVESGHCTCMAGVAEKCAHVAALLYNIDTTVRLRGNVTPTDVEAYWVMPSNITKVQGVPGHTVDFTTSSARKKALDRSVCGDTSTAPKIRTRSGGTCLPQKTLADLKPLTELMHAHRSGLCSVMEEFCHLYVDPIQPCVLPKSLLRLRDPQMDGCDLSVLLQHCEGYGKGLLHHTDGVRHRDMKVEHCGFIINPSFPEIGATPDALVHCACCGKGCVEIKCPFKHKDHNILQACTDKEFCLQFTEGRMELKQTHKYYKQVQTQIFVTESQFCDFVVWTTKSLATVRVMPDVELWETLLPTAQTFFYKVVLPELVARHYTQPPPPVPSAELPVPPADSQPTDKPKKRAQKSTVRKTLATLQPDLLPL
ncbi:uncharacterized protein LOC143104968 isoform X2 [Alosa pseudoharengus]|uniref:uncharacterized protein LOC143104968 isoform X2 n=1 Tax=Alosa pseudoharengus TaxID=34774 RepID=UPI003F8BFFD1